MLDPQTIISLVLENGFMAIASAIVLYVFLKNQVATKKREIEQEKQTKEEREQRSREFTLLIENLVEQTNKNKISIHSIEEDEFQEEVNNCITDSLKKLRASTQADRAIFVRYHNGVYDLAGNSVIKMSTTNEDVKVGISPMAPFLQNQYRSFFNYWCATIRDSGKIILEDVNELIMRNENPMYEFMKARGVQAAAGHAIYDNNKNVIGFIMIEYMSSIPLPLKQIESCLNDKATKISAFMLLSKDNLICSKKE